MARLPRDEVIAPDEVAIAHVINRAVRRCFLIGNEEVSGKDGDPVKLSVARRRLSSIT